MKSSRICHNGTCHFGTLIILSCRHLKNSKYRRQILGVSPELPVSACRWICKSNSVVINSLPRSCTNQGKIDSCTGKETRSDITPRSTLSQTIHTSHLFFLRTHLSFPKRHLLSSKKPIFPFSFSIKMMFKLEF